MVCSHMKLIAAVDEAVMSICLTGPLLALAVAIPNHSTRSLYSLSHVAPKLSSKLGSFECSLFAYTLPGQCYHWSKAMVEYLLGSMRRGLIDSMDWCEGYLYSHICHLICHRAE